MVIGREMRNMHPSGCFYFTQKGMIYMIFGRRKKTYRIIMDCDTAENIGAETKEITINQLNKILCDMINQSLEEIGVINLRVEVLEDDHSM